jgi:Tol biopolymer transport system component
VFPVRTSEGNQLAVRLLAEPKATPLTGTEGGINPFFAPNGEWVAFGAAGKIKKVSIHGGAPLILCDGALRGGTWTEDGYIIASLGNSTGLSRIPDGGGQPEALTTPAKGELTLRWPQILPGGKAVLFSASASQSNWENATIDVLSLKTGQRKTVQKGGFFGRYLPSGHLVYVRGGALYGAPFDTDRLELTGPPATLLEDLAASSFGGGQFDFSRNGTFVYTSGTPKSYGWGIVSVDSRGTVQPVVSTRGIYFRLALSPEGNRLALAAGSPGAADLWVYELDREISTRLTFSSDAVGGVWSPDGRYLVHSTTPGENSAIVAVRADGVGQRRRLLPAADKQTPLIPQAFSPDGRYLVFLRFRRGLSDMWSVEISHTASGELQAGKAEPLLESPAAEAGAAISPDGRWIAYNSNESGRYEVFVRPFGSGRITSGGKWQVSANGGANPVWSKAGKQVLFLTPSDHIMVADYAVDGESFRVSKPRPWVDKPIPTYTFLSGLPFGQGLAAFDLSRDGRKIITFDAPEAAYAPKGNLHVTMLVNWFDTVRRRVGGARN